MKVIKNVFFDKIFRSLLKIQILALKFIFSIVLQRKLLN